MLIQQLLTPNSTLSGVDGVSKKRVLEIISHQVATLNTELDPDDVFSGLIGREKLGSTGIGSGVAIPHCRCTGCTQPLAVLMTLDEPIDFDSLDSKPVDMLFTLVVPEEATEEHLQLLASVAELFSNEGACKRLREATSNEALFDTINTLH
ncbi:MAG: PTS IIA-like nitrogen regulatory protein PtsN [Pontibacterium sp.]